MEFWQRVRSDFLKSEDKWLCHGSIEFQTAWQSDFHRQNIIHLTKQFLEGDGVRYFDTQIKDRGLFEMMLNGLFDYHDAREIRLDFLQWVIHRLEKQEAEKKAFWEKILTEFEANKQEAYLCEVSSDFYERWDNNNQFAVYVRTLAVEFLNYQYPSYKNMTVITFSQNLFDTRLIPDHTVTDAYRRLIRLDFLKWVISTLEKEVENG